MLAQQSLQPPSRKISSPRCLSVSSLRPEWLCLYIPASLCHWIQALLERALPQMQQLAQAAVCWPYSLLLGSTSVLVGTPGGHISVSATSTGSHSSHPTLLQITALQKFIPVANQLYRVPSNYKYKSNSINLILRLGNKSSSHTYLKEITLLAVSSSQYGHSKRDESLIFPSFKLFRNHLKCFFLCSAIGKAESSSKPWLMYN